MDIKIFGQVGGLGFDVDKIVSDINSAEEEINIHMMSVGGTAIYGLSIFDALMASKQKTNAFYLWLCIFCGFGNLRGL